MKDSGISFSGMSNDTLRAYFDIDWEYEIDQDGYNKSTAFSEWKRGLRGSN